jgi:hypothetical protein
MRTTLAPSAANSGTHEVPAVRMCVVGCGCGFSQPLSILLYRGLDWKHAESQDLGLLSQCFASFLLAIFFEPPVPSCPDCKEEFRLEYVWAEEIEQLDRNERALAYCRSVYEDSEYHSILCLWRYIVIKALPLETLFNLGIFDSLTSNTKSSGSVMREDAQ